MFFQFVILRLDRSIQGKGTGFPLLGESPGRPIKPACPVGKSGNGQPCLSLMATEAAHRYHEELRADDSVRRRNANRS